MADRVVCVLGCRVGSAAFGRRGAAAARVARERGADLVVACGGRAWGGRVEADALADLVVAGGVPREAIVRERLSLDTYDNARFAAAILRRHDVSSVIVVTCSWHLPRAVMLFRAAGLEVEGVGVPPPDPTATQRAYWKVREAVTSWKDARRVMRIP
ncbi:MAG: YdcF family protein [Deltaproteobacteria bacterium]|nr:YdcF family protein [Deltaproteobacteria bacterium]